MIVITSWLLIIKKSKESLSLLKKGADIVKFNRFKALIKINQQ